MDNEPLISVVMPTFNETKEELNDSINSILNQTYNNLELVIVDDNPKSYSLKKYLNKVSRTYNNIKVFFDKKNLKEGAANKAVEHASGKYVVRMDADDIAYKDRIVNQYQFLVEHQLDFVFSNFSLVNSKGILTRKYTYAKHSSQVNQKNVKKIVSCGNMTVGPTFFFKKSLFKKLNGYRSINGEDYDLVARALINEYRVGFQSFPVIYKRIRYNSITYNGILDQYIAQRTISMYLHKYKFKKIMPIGLLKHHWSNVSRTQVKHFKSYEYARFCVNENKNLFNILKLIKSICQSKIIIKRILYSIVNKYKVKHIKE